MRIMHLRPPSFAQVLRCQVLAHGGVNFPEGASSVLLVCTNPAAEEIDHIELDFCDFPPWWALNLDSVRYPGTAPGGGRIFHINMFASLLNFSAETPIDLAVIQNQIVNVNINDDRSLFGLFVLEGRQVIHQLKALSLEDTSQKICPQVARTWVPIQCLA